MNDFISAMSASQNRTSRTENGAVTLNSSNSSVLDFFSTAGAYRTRSEQDITQAFSKAFSESRELAMKALFYIRDCRGGQGERRTFRICLDWLAKNYPEILGPNFYNVPFFGRWDDTFATKEIANVFGGHLYSQFHALKDQKDFAALNLAKWLPSENTSSKKSVALARWLCKQFQVSPREYRKILSAAREKLGIVEREISARRWEGIKFEKVPSKASLLYRKAFWKHVPELYEKYIEKVEKGEAKINSSVTYPYEIVREYLIKGSNNDRILNAAWNALPNYIEEGDRALVMADVSGSMNSPDCIPISVSISLALYLAERNTDPIFGNHFMTFSNKPSLVKIQGINLFEKIQNLNKAKWSMNTNLQAAFNVILETAVKNKLDPEVMPTKFFIVSDMEFDSCCNSRTNFETIKSKYEVYGYKMPTLIFWNVNAKSSQSPVEFNEKGVMLVSGCSPSIFKNTLASKTTTPFDLMLEVLNSERYSKILTA